MLCNLKSILKLLIQSGANINIKQAKKDKNTPAHVAAAVGNVKCLYMLLQAGADMSQTNKRGKTVLEWAIQHSQAACVQILCAYMEAQKNGVPVPPNPELEAEFAPSALNVVRVHPTWHPIDQVQNLERRASQAESMMSELAMKLKEAEEAVRRYRQQLGEPEEPVAEVKASSLPPPPPSKSLPPPPPAPSPTKAAVAPSPSPVKLAGARPVLTPVAQLTSPGRTPVRAATLTSPIRMGVAHLIGLEDEAVTKLNFDVESSGTESPSNAGSVSENSQASSTGAVAASPAPVASPTPASPIRPGAVATAGAGITREALLAAARNLQPSTPIRIKHATMPIALAGTPNREVLANVLNEIRQGVHLRPVDNRPVVDNQPTLIDELKRTLKMKRRHVRQESRVSDDWNIPSTSSTAGPVKSPVKMNQMPQESPRKAVSSCSAILESGSSADMNTITSLTANLTISSDKENMC